jgi:clan AA aspartic protease (TIGR02281 family)
VRIRRSVRLVLFAVLTSSAGFSHANWCGADRYFAPHDSDNTTPLKSPHADFRKTQRLAAGGNAEEERNLGAYYDSGYLVSVCREKAAYWYAKAAMHGDAIAKAWLERHSAMEIVRNNSECFGDTCFASPAVVIQKTVLERGAGGAYSAVVTINSKTVRGIVDTGATFMSMSAKTAAELGVRYESGKELEMTTANGKTKGRAVTLNSVAIGNITLNEIEAVVSEADHPLLIGMSFLSRLTINTNGNGMTLTKP